MRKIFVTGGSSGIGEAVVRALALANYDVTFSYFRSEKRALELAHDLNVSSGASVRAIKCDLSDQIAVTKLTHALYSEAEAYYGIVHSAGCVYNTLALIADIDRGKTTMQVNFWSIVAICSQLLRAMSRYRSGRVVFIGSIAASGGIRGNSIYAATKAALEGYARSLVQEVASRNITVNVVAPGFVDTPMLDFLDKSTREYLVEHIPSGRVGTPADIAAVVTFLLSDAATHINGITLTVDGGLSSVAI